MDRSREPSRPGVRGLCVILVLFICAMSVPQAWRAWSDRPNQPQRIAAILVSWGLSPDGLRLPVDEREIDRHIDMLRSPYGEDRVRAAHWLASHGVRDAAGEIALAMNDPLTARPCQLAHALGHLGDDRYADELVRAANQPWNRDLQVCGTIGLEALGSERAVGALIDLAHHGTARTSAIEALGVIGNGEAMPHLRQIIETTDNPIVRRAAHRAIERISILNEGDPLPPLIAQFEDSLRERHVDEWSLRWIAKMGDERAASVLASALEDGRVSDQGAESIAASLLALEDAGLAALHRVAKSKSPSAGVAGSALSLVPDDTTVRIAAR